MKTKPKTRKLNTARPIALRLTDVERTQAFRMAADDGRSAAGFARAMYLRGLREYVGETGKAA
jgi:hypothetical protein